MPCYKPLTAYRSQGKICFKRPHRLAEELKLPCNQCIGCRISRSRQWAIRCVHEASLHQHNTFITLTYDQENLPPHGNLIKADFQKFMKRLRRRYPEKQIRYYMCGEYGEKLGRPHFHALLFNFDFMDKKPWNYRRKNITYRSKILERLWPFGYSEIGNVTYQSAAYVARYVMKKITGEQAADHYQRIDKESGEIHELEPEYNNMSLKPGIAKDWYEKYKGDVFPSDQIVTIDGKVHKTPKYYYEQLKKEDPATFEIINQRRKDQALQNPEKYLPHRLEAMEKCAQARNEKLIRELK